MRTFVSRWLGKSERFWDRVLGTRTHERDRAKARFTFTQLEDRVVPDSRPLPLPTLYVGAGVGAEPVVKVFDIDSGKMVREQLAYEQSFRGGVRVATGDINRDTLPDLVTAPGPGGGPRVRVLDYKTGKSVPGLLGSFYAYEPTFTGGVSVAVADVNGDEVPDIITAAGYGGGPRVRVFNGKNGQVLNDFFAYDADFRGGVNVAAADITGDKRAEIIVGAGEGGGPRIKVYDLSTNEAVVLQSPLGDFFAFDPMFRGGVNVAAGDVNGDGIQDVIAGAGAGMSSRVRVFSGKTGKVLTEFDAFDASMQSGVRVSAFYVDNDAKADIAVASGPGSSGRVRVYSGMSEKLVSGPLADFQPMGGGELGGLYIAAGNDPPPGPTAPSGGELIYAPDLPLVAPDSVVDYFDEAEICSCECEDSTGHSSDGSIRTNDHVNGSGGVLKLIHHEGPYDPKDVVSTGPYIADPSNPGQVTLYSSSLAPANKTGKPVRYFDGVASVETVDFPTDANGWGIKRVWSNNANYSYGQPSGNGWVLTGPSQMPYLQQPGPTTLAIVSAPGATTFFEGYGSQLKTGQGVPTGLYAKYVSVFGNSGVVTYSLSTNQFTYLAASGSKLVFAGPNTNGQIGGNFISRVDRNGTMTSVVSRNSAKLPTEVEVSVTSGSTTVITSYLYTYTNDNYISSILQRRKIGTSGSWNAIRSVEYEYYGANDANGRTYDLKTSTTRDANGNIVDKSYYRYYVEDTFDEEDNQIGYSSGLKYELSPVSYARLKAVLGSDSAVQSASDATIAPYADKYFEYDSSHRVTKEIAAGEGDTTFAYTTSSNYFGFNSWKKKTVVGHSDGSTQTVYTNGYAQVMMDIVQSSGEDPSITYYRYSDESSDEGAGQLLLKAHPSAVSGYSDSNSDLVSYTSGNAYYLRDNEGLIQTYEWGQSTTATDSTTGDVEGYLKQANLRHGETGTPIPQLQVSYIARTVDSSAIYLVASKTSYRNDNGTGAITINSSYSFYTSSFQVSTATTTLPAVATAENGSNTETSYTVVYDTYGRPIWQKDPAGILTYNQYDPVTGALIKAIVDVDTTQTSDFASLPSGWSTPSGGGQHRVTAYELDDLGRAVKGTSPGGTVDYVVYDDANHEVRLYSGWNTTTNTPTEPTVVVRFDRANGYSEALTMTATPNVSSGRPTGTEAISNLQSLSRTVLNSAGQLVYQDDYFNLSGISYSTNTTLGTAGTNYLRTQYDYDERGRENRILSPAGTITRTVRNDHGHLESIWIGTDDTPTTGYWSTTNLTGTDMVKVAEFEYDNGGVGEGHLTRRTLFPGNGRDPIRTDYVNDFRGRPVAIKQGVETSESTSVNRPLIFLSYDNLGQVIESKLYDGDGVTPSLTAPSSSLLRAKSVTSYDSLGRAYKIESYGVDQSSGTVATTPLTSQYWYNSQGLPIKATSPDGLVEKVSYNSLGQPITTYLTNGGGDSGYSDADDVAGDTVWSQLEYAYDSDGRVIKVTSRDRFHGETGTGELGTATTGVKARVEYSGNYYDLAGRLTDTVYVGTNGGSAWTRPSTVPSRSDTVLVTSVSYGSDGMPLDVTDPKGIVARTSYDLLGRVTSQTAAHGTSDAFSVSYAYDSSGRLQSITAPGSRVTSFGYDSWGRNTSVTERYGTSLARTTTTALDNLGTALSVTNAASTVTAFATDPLGRTTSVTAASGTSLARTVSTAFDTLGRTLSITDPRSNTTSFSYDDLDREMTVTDALGNSTVTAFDAAGRATTVTDAYGKTWTTAYDLLGRVTSNTDPLSNSTSIAYNVNGTTLRVTDPRGKSSDTVSNSLGRIGSTIDALGYTTLFSYDRNGNTTQVEDASGNITSFAFDNLDRVTSETDPLGKSTTYAYNSTGTLASITDRLGRKREWTYDAADRPTAETWYSASNTQLQQQTFGYDILDRLTSATDPDGSYTLTYDALGQVTQVQGPWSVTQDFEYDVAGNRTKASDSTGGVVTSTYDARNRLSSRTLTGTGLSPVRAEWSYTKTGEVSTLSRFSDASGSTKVGSTSYSYDDARRLVGIDHKNGSGTSIDSFSYAYDAASRLTSETRNSTTRTFGYDDTHQLTSDNGSSLSYDKTGNRTNSGYSTSTGNRLTSDGTWSYSYNDEGEIVTKSKSGEHWTYEYDLRGQLTKAEKRASSGGSVIDSVTYAYDAFGNRISRVQTGTSSSTARYVVDGWDTSKPGAIGSENFDVVLDLDGSNTVTMRRVFGSGFDDLVAREDASGVVKWYGTDHLGSVRAIFDNAGGVSNAVDYDAFGGILSGVNVDRYSWTGREADALTGLRHNRAREYDPAIGRWYSEDPIGFAAGDVNLFRYVGNAYTVTTDPSGYVWPFSAVVGGVIGAAAGAVGQVVGNAINGKPLGEGVGGAAVGGAVAGALIGAAGPVGVAAIAGASAGATAIGAGVASTINQIEESGAVSVKKVAQDAAIGAVAGTVGGGVGGAVGIVGGVLKAGRAGTPALDRAVLKPSAEAASSLPPAFRQAYVPRSNCVAPATPKPPAAPAAGAFNPADFVGQQAVVTPHLPAGTYTALVVDGKVYVARMHISAWELAGKKGVEQFYGFAEIDAAGKVVRLIK